MADIRTKIDELIEESYLATLTEEDIRTDLLRFIDVCDRLLRDSHDTNQDVLRQIEEYKSIALRIEKATELADKQEEWAVWSQRDLLAHRAARLKLLVLDTIREIDGTLADQIERGRFSSLNSDRQETKTATLPPKTQVIRRPSTQLPHEALMPLIRICYALLTGATVFLIGYRIFH
ncbi:MAG TPA: hypothetical protein ENN56_00510 [Firmicutes bacterium]|nr:hypothetical protein [Bacillota bacterium]